MPELLPIPEMPKAACELLLFCKLPTVPMLAFPWAELFCCNCPLAMLVTAERVAVLSPWVLVPTFVWVLCAKALPENAVMAMMAGTINSFFMRKLHSVSSKKSQLDFGIPFTPK